MMLTVLAEGNKWVAVNKPAGIGVEKHYDHDTVEKRALKQFQRPGATKPPYVGIAHRLDRPVSGVLLLARNKSTLVALNESFAAGKIQKEYWAITSAPPPRPAGELRHFLMRDKLRKKAIASGRPLPGAQESRLKYKVIEALDGDYLLSIQPITGRFHQIRAQLAAINCPIIGDGLYGNMAPFTGDHQIALHARRLAFVPPHSKEKVVIEAPLPEEWVKWKEELAGVKV